MKTKTLSEEISTKINRCSKKSWGVSRIFNHLKKLDSCKDQVNLGLLRFILLEFQRAGKSPSKEMVRYFFRTKVPKNEWEGSNKKEILADLYNPLDIH